METKTKGILGGVGVTALAGLAGYIILFSDAWEKIDNIVVTETEYTERQGAFAQAVEPYHEQSEINTWDRKWNRFKYLEYKKCHQAALDTFEEAEFLKLDRELDIQWRGCDE